MQNETAKRKIFGLIGLCEKAGKIRSGEFSTEKSIKTGKSALCIVAKDASDNTKKHFSDMCAFRHVPIYTEEIEKEDLGHIIGKAMRASISVEDSGFAKRLMELIEGGNADE